MRISPAAISRNTLIALLVCEQMSLAGNGQLDKFVCTLNLI